MTKIPDLKMIERRAFRSTYEDGLWDIYYGLIVICMSFFLYRPLSGYRPMNIFLSVVGIAVCYGLFALAKRHITVPRMGQVTFGEIRRRKKRTMAIILLVFISVQIILVVLTSLGWLTKVIAPSQQPLLIVSLIGSLMVGSGMLVSTSFTDFQRGTYISLLMALAVFFMIFLNQPLIPVLIGFVIIVPGVILFFRFLRKYPLSDGKVEHE